MKYVHQMIFSIRGLSLAILFLATFNSCDETQRVHGFTDIKQYTVKNVLMTASELSSVYNNKGLTFSKLSFKLITLTTGELFPQFYAVMSDGSVLTFNNVISQGKGQKLWLKPFDEAKYFISYDFQKDQIYSLLAIPKVDHFVLQPWGLDDPNCTSDPNLLEYYITPYDAADNEIDLTSTLPTVSTDKLERLIRIDPIPPGSRYQDIK